MAQAHLQVVHSRGPLQTQHGAGPGGGDMESRITKLESDVSHIQSDIGDIKQDLRTLLKGGIGAFILTWVGIIAATLGLAYLMAKGFYWL